jgi:hypothetical protein
MTQLLEDVLLIGKVEAGKLNFTPSPIDLTAFCRQLLAETQLTTDRKYCLTFNSHGPTQKVWIDQKLLRQILTNLLSGYGAGIRNHGHSCFLCEIVIRSQFHTTYEPEA